MLGNTTFHITNLAIERNMRNASMQQQQQQQEQYISA